MPDKKLDLRGYCSTPQCQAASCEDKRQPKLGLLIPPAIYLPECPRCIYQNTQQGCACEMCGARLKRKEINTGVEQEAADEEYEEK